MVSYQPRWSLSWLGCKRVGRLSLRRERGRVRVLLRATGESGFPNPSPQFSPLAQGRGGKTFLKANIKPAGKEKNGEQDCPRLFF